MIELVLASVYFMLPAYIANMCPVIFGKLNFPFGRPIHKKLFGAHKTYRGFYTAYIGALLTLLLQLYLTNRGILTDYTLLDYTKISLPLYAALFGFGAITGDLIKSFFKRRLHIKPGRPWFPFDQLDFVLGAYLFLLPVFILPWPNLLTILILTPALHFLANLSGYFLGIKKVWW